MRTLSLTAAMSAALLMIGCVSTTANQADGNPTVVTSDTARPQTLFAARLQPVAGVMTAEQANGSVKVSFPGITAFSHDGAGLSTELQQQLNAVADLLKNTTYQKLVVLGHSDSSGQLAYNNKLSQQRAEQVKTFLLQQGLSTEQLSAEGRGPAEPLADNKTTQGRAANRRVELEVAF